jgi:hypothetical protein
MTSGAAGLVSGRRLDLVVVHGREINVSRAWFSKQPSADAPIESAVIKQRL